MMIDKKKEKDDKNAGFIILLTSIFTFFFFGEIRNLTTFTRLMDYNNGFSLSSFFLSHLSFLWIGAQFPQEKVLSYGRILTLHYYFLLMCILFSIPSKGNSLELVSSFQECPQGLQFPLQIRIWYLLSSFLVISLYSRSLLSLPLRI